MLNLKAEFESCTLARAFLAGILIGISPMLISQENNDVNGDWFGELNVQTMKLRVAFHVVSNNAGFTGTMASLDQNITGIPLSKVSISDRDVTLEVARINGDFTGELSDDGSSLVGTWEQRGQKIPLTLRRGNAAESITLTRPQTPQPPFPYNTEEVLINNPNAKVKLGGTLTLPKGSGPFPVAILITGSGVQDRNESLMGHQPFLVLSDYLTRYGIATLRTDDRGIGQSTGDFQSSSIRDFAGDVEAQLQFLKTRPEINHQQMGLIGHSEGGMVASMLAHSNDDVNFIVLMASPGVSGKDLLIAQSVALAEVQGLGSQQLRMIKDQNSRLLELAVSSRTDEQVYRRLNNRLSGPALDQVTAQMQQLRSPKAQIVLKYNPADDFSRTQIPVVAIIGTKDRQVPAEQNLPEIRKALENAENPHFEVVALPELNHLFQTAKTGAPSEYRDIEETMAPIALEKITQWITGLYSKNS